jgi:hypothetical protein
MDNRHLDITSEENDNMKHAMAVAFCSSKYSKYTATHWAIVQGCLVFFWGRPAHSNGDLYQVGPDLVDPVQFMVPLAAEGAAYAAMEWLGSDRAKWPEKPDIDGSCGAGWRVFTRDMEGRQLFGMYQAIVAVQPVWAEYHK